MEPKKKSMVYWHPAFYADIQIELKDEADKLTFENEHHLSKKPMQIDVLIIKKEKAGKKYEVEKAEDGIYRVKGDVFPIQILVTKELSEKENLWLKSLTNDLKEPENARKLIEDYQKNQENNLYRSALETIMRANQKVLVVSSNL